MDIRKEREDLFKKFKKVMLPLTVVVSIAYIAIGAVYLHDCPVQEMIPIYLIVAGAFACFPFLGDLCSSKGSESFFKIKLRKSFASWNSLVTKFLFCWFLTGNYWIYSVFEPSYDKNGTDVSRYCNKTLYLFSFSTTTIIYILLGIALAIISNWTG